MKPVWIQPQNAAHTINVYACFRREFFLNQPIPERVDLQFSANFNGQIFCNGTEILRGQFPDYPDRKTVTTLDCAPFLQPGRNVLAILVYNPGTNFSTTPQGPLALWCRLALPEGDLVTDTQWRAAEHAAFLSGDISKLTVQLGFNFCCDLRRAEPWTDPDFEDAGWLPAVPVPDYAPSLFPRPLAPVIPGHFLPASLLREYPIFREMERETFAETVTADQRAETGNGMLQIYDLGMECVGYLLLEWDAAAGTVLDISFGEHLDDGTVRCRIGNRNFTDRIISAEGYNCFSMPLRRFGCRYLQLNITRAECPVQIRRIGLEDATHPLPEPAEFHTDRDEEVQRLRSCAIRTLQMCMHDHYEDCPWREQSLYAYDSRNQILFGNYLWLNYDFAAASLRLLGGGWNAETGLLNLCAPCGTPTPVVIPIFTLVWVAELWEYLLYSGDLSLVQELASTYRLIAEHTAAQQDPATGLLLRPRGAGMWNFYEWTLGLDGNLSDLTKPQAEIHALHNLYAVEMFRAAARLDAALGDHAGAERQQQRADVLGKIVESYFRHPDGGYRITRETQDRHCHTQILMLALDLAPESERDALWEAITHPETIPLTFSPLPYFLRGMFRLSPEARAFARDYIDRSMLTMLDQGATTFYETPLGGDDFNNAGSLCHAWSAIHPYFYGAFTLGVEPLTPGFATFRVKPWPGKFRRAEGEVPTPAGKIAVQWHLDDAGKIHLQVRHPASLQMQIDSYPEFPLASAEETIG